MSFRIEEKLYIRYENLLDFKNFYIKTLQKIYMNLGRLKVYIMII